MGIESYHKSRDLTALPPNPGSNGVNWSQNAFVPPSSWSPNGGQEIWNLTRVALTRTDTPKSCLSWSTIGPRTEVLWLREPEQTQLPD